MQQKTADLVGRIGYDAEGREMFCFGKYKGQSLWDVFRREPTYYAWIQEGDFPLYTKRVCRKVMDEVREEKRLKKLQERFPSKTQKKTQPEPAPKWDAKPGELQF